MNQLRNKFPIKILGYFILFLAASCAFAQNSDNSNIVGYYYLWYKHSSKEKPDYREVQVDDKRFYFVSLIEGFTAPSKYSITGNKIQFFREDEADLPLYEIVEDTKNYLKIKAKDNSEILVLYKMGFMPNIGVKNASTKENSEMFSDQFMNRLDSLYAEYMNDSLNIQLSGSPNLLITPRR